MLKVTTDTIIKKEMKYKLSSLSKLARFRTYAKSFAWLNEAMIVNTCYNCTDPTVALALNSDTATPKCYTSDTGLLVSQSFMSSSFTDNDLYKAVLFDKLDINEGMIMENAVAQMLRANGHKLYFYSRNDPKYLLSLDTILPTANYDRVKKLSPIDWLLDMPQK